MSTTHTAIGYTDNLPATDPESFVARDVETPQPGPHDLLVDVQAVSVNPVDRKLRAALPPATSACWGSTPPVPSAPSATK